MSDDPVFDRALPGQPGEIVALSPLVRRIVADNGGPFTFTGTCTYIVGHGEVAVIDPGPDDPAHIEAVAGALANERVRAILVTHTHRDHSPGAPLLAALTGAPVVGCPPHRAARELAEGELNVLDASADRDYAPDRILAEGDVVSGPGWTLTAVETPGHTMNHLAFALAEEETLFSGDHVMAWSTSIVAPPDGAMGPYMASLEKLKGRSETIYWPGHGGAVREPARFVRALLQHRRQREAAILRRLEAGDRAIPAIVAHVYEGIAPILTGAAALSVLAHLEDLVDRDLVRCDAAPTLEALYRPAGG